MSDPPTERLQRTHLEFIQYAFQCDTQYVLLRDAEMAIPIKTKTTRNLTRSVAVFTLGNIKYEVSEYLPEDSQVGSVHRGWYDQGHWMLWLRDLVHTHTTLVVESYVLTYTATWPNLPIYNVEEDANFFLKNMVRPLTATDLMAVLNAFHGGDEARVLEAMSYRSLVFGFVFKSERSVFSFTTATRRSDFFYRVQV